ncbi:hypothetical protein EVAR_81604_1 [Eumeta japonica]|uniref:Uncharacterized protein n=1 Tax=Eumeta variegata TaxID=151549 RepID=A0A4C1WFW3_EUMVA|nr:hypothetical protein EVAR_81604_1 [Eumeta japonica]
MRRIHLRSGVIYSQTGVHPGAPVPISSRPFVNRVEWISGNEGTTLNNKSTPKRKRLDSVERLRFRSKTFFKLTELLRRRPASDEAESAHFFTRRFSREIMRQETSYDREKKMENKRCLVKERRKKLLASPNYDKKTYKYLGNIVYLNEKLNLSNYYQEPSHHRQVKIPPEPACERPQEMMPQQNSLVSHVTPSAGGWRRARAFSAHLLLLGGCINVRGVFYSKA